MKFPLHGKHAVNIHVDLALGGQRISKEQPSRRARGYIAFCPEAWHVPRIRSCAEEYRTLGAKSYGNHVGLPGGSSDSEFQDQRVVEPAPDHREPLRTVKSQES